MYCESTAGVRDWPLEGGCGGIYWYLSWYDSRRWYVAHMAVFSEVAMPVVLSSSTSDAIVGCCAVLGMILVVGCCQAAVQQYCCAVLGMIVGCYPAAVQRYCCRISL